MRVAGFGCRQSASVDSLQSALAVAQGLLTSTHTPTANESVPQDALAIQKGKANLITLDALAAPTDKATQLAPLAEALGLPLILIDDATLQAQSTPTNSLYSKTARGTGSVAEAAALAAAGSNATLLVRRCISPDHLATCAIAEGVVS